MKIALLVILCLIVLALVAYFIFFPRNTFISLQKPTGATITFSRTSVSVEPPPDYYAANGFDHIEPYISRLLVPSKKLKFLSIFSPDRHRGFSLHAAGGKFEAALNLVDWRRESVKETAIRSFFKSLDIIPSQDYLAGNGNVPDAARILSYPIQGNVTEVTVLTKRILQELCDVSPTEALNINYSDK